MFNLDTRYTDYCSSQCVALVDLPDINLFGNIEYIWALGLTFKSTLCFGTESGTVHFYEYGRVIGLSAMPCRVRTCVALQQYSRHRLCYTGATVVAPTVDRHHETTSFASVPGRVHMGTFDGTTAAVFLHAPDTLDVCQRTHPPGVVAYYFLRRHSSKTSIAQHNRYVYMQSDPTPYIAVARDVSVGLATYVNNV